MTHSIILSLSQCSEIISGWVYNRGNNKVQYVTHYYLTIFQSLEEILERVRKRRSDKPHDVTIYCFAFYRVNIGMNL